MRSLFYILVIAFVSCTNRKNQTGKITPVDTVLKSEKSPKIDNSKYYTTKDTIIITNEMDDTLQFEKQEFNHLVDNHPEFMAANMNHPEVAYYNTTEKEGFDSEAGQDAYYILYAYFLKLQNGETKYFDRRKKLIEIYSNINSLFGYFEYGGTYFGHQHARIPGYAEYSIYLYKPYEIYRTSKTYDITRQKDLYIKSLRQLITDENKIDFNMLGKDKIPRMKTLNKIVDAIDSAITDIYYLRRAQEFQYRHYEYY